MSGLVASVSGRRPGSAWAAGRCVRSAAADSVSSDGAIVAPDSGSASWSTSVTPDAVSSSGGLGAMLSLLDGRRARMRSSEVAWSAAPAATASSGLTSVRGALPKNLLTWSRT